jgi:hypothetical protein
MSGECGPFNVVDHEGVWAHSRVGAITNTEVIQNDGDVGGDACDVVQGLLHLGDGGDRDLQTIPTVGGSEVLEE